MKSSRSGKRHREMVAFPCHCERVCFAHDRGNLLSCYRREHEKESANKRDDG